MVRVIGRSATSCNVVPRTWLHCSSFGFSKMWCYQVVSSSYSAHAESCTPTWLRKCQYPHRWTLHKSTEIRVKQPVLRQTTYKAGCSSCTLEGYKPLHALTLPLQPCPGAGSTRMQASRSSWDFPLTSKANPLPTFAEAESTADAPTTSARSLGRVSSTPELAKSFAKASPPPNLAKSLVALTSELPFYENKKSCLKSDRKV